MLRLPRQLGNLASGFCSSEEKNGGEGGIRTLGSLATTHDFQSCTFDHSVTSPGVRPTAHGAASRRAKGCKKDFHLPRVNDQLLHPTPQASRKPCQPPPGAARYGYATLIALPMPFRIAKSFTVESGHLLTKHPGACRFPHGHSRTIEIVVASDALN